MGRVASDPGRGGPNVVHGCETERKKESLCWNPKPIQFIYSADECGGYFLFGVQKFPSRFCWFLGRKDNNGVFISICPFHISRVWFSGSGIPFLASSFPSIARAQVTWEDPTGRDYISARFFLCSVPCLVKMQGFGKEGFAWSNGRGGGL